MRSREPKNQGEQMAASKKISSKRDNERVLFKELCEDFLPRLYASGIITDADLSTRESFTRWVREFFADREISVVIDHRSSILKTAESYQRSENFDFSAVFYAVFFEHTINHIIDSKLSKDGFKKSTVRELIRSANLEAKLGWVIEIIQLPAIRPSHKKTILSVANKRNAFLHHKWERSPNDHDTQEHHLKQLLASAKKSVAYLRQYESRHLYEGKKGKALKALRRRLS